MNRRRIHQSIAAAVTLGFLAATGYSVFRGDLRMFSVGCIGYVAFLALFSLVCWLSMPRELRKAPLLPEEFRALRLGPVTHAIEAILGESPALKDRRVGTKQHRLYRMERSFPEGSWICAAETADGELIAYSVTFESTHSPVLDKGHSQGTGYFVNNSPSG